MVMHRRYTGAHLERRHMRGPRASPGGDTYQSILGSLLVEMWHSQLGIATVSGNVDTWTGQIAGTVLQAPAAGQRPAYAADGTVFGGKSVVQCATTGSHYLRNLAIPAGFIPSGTRPWLAWVQRIRTSATISVWDIETASATQMNLYTLTAVTDGRIFANGADRVTGANLTSARALVAGYYDGVNANISVNGTVKSTAFAGSTVADITRMSIGANVVGGQVSDTSFAIGWLCSSQPSAAQYTALSALALAEFPP